MSMSFYVLYTWGGYVLQFFVFQLSNVEARLVVVGWGPSANSRMCHRMREP